MIAMADSRSSHRCPTPIAAENLHGRQRRAEVKCAQVDALGCHQEFGDDHLDSNGVVAHPGTETARRKHRASGGHVTARGGSNSDFG